MNDKLVNQADLYDTIESFKLKQLNRDQQPHAVPTTPGNFNKSQSIQMNPADDAHQPADNKHSFFSLSKPFLLNLLTIKSNEPNEESQTSVLTMPCHRFTFVEPFESSHLGGLKMKQPSLLASNRLLPYTKSKPIAEPKSISNLAVISSSLTALSASSSQPNATR